MTEGPKSIDRRALITSAAAAGLVATLAGLDTPAVAAAAQPTQGKAGDFNFLAGEWKIRHRKVKTPGKDDWEEFDGEATCWTILGGVGSVEELRIPATQLQRHGPAAAGCREAHLVRLLGEQSLAACSPPPALLASS